MTPQKEADEHLHNLIKLEPAKEDRRASQIPVPVKNTGRLLHSTDVTARYETGHGQRNTVRAFRLHGEK